LLNLNISYGVRFPGTRSPDAKTLGKLGVALGPQIIEQIHQRVVAIAQEKKIIRGRKMRVDTTVVETDIHYPTDSTLLGDGVRVLTRAMKKIGDLAGAVGTQLRDRTRSVCHCLINIGRASRSRVLQGKKRMQQSYGKLLSITGRVVGQARRFVREVEGGIKRSACILSQAGIQAERKYLQTMIARVQQVMKQTRERIFKGNPHSSGKLVSLFEAHSEIIRKGNASKPTEFGKMVKIQEAEQQIVTHYEVYDERPSDSDLLVPALDVHEQQFGRPPRRVAAKAPEATVVPQRPEVAHRGRRPHQPLEETTRTQSMSLQGTRRHSALGGTWRCRRRPDQHRPGSRSTQALRPSPLPPPRTQTKAADHGGLGLSLRAAQNLKNGIFAPESS